MTQILITAVYAVAMVADWWPGVACERKRVRITGAVLLAASWLVMILASLDVNIPSPFIPVEKLIKSVFGI